MVDQFILAPCTPFLFNGGPNMANIADGIRSIVTKNGGSIAAAGAVSRLFNCRGQIIVARDAANEDALMELALESGAEDFLAEPEGYEILTDPAHFEENEDVKELHHNAEFAAER